MVQTVCSISIHALREERDRLLPLPPEPHRNFNPRAPRGARRAVLRERINRAISIHALREERDQCDRSTLYGCAHISIHALREERDSLRSIIQKDSTDFNPRAPRGARQAPIGLMWKVKIFQSTRSARSATIRKLRNTSMLGISIHALREERDQTTRYKRPHRERFQSTRSARSATRMTDLKEYVIRISIHALREERDGQEGNLLLFAK